ncbi:hypothetical protein B6S12_10175 [Helicobacter valdiviensis]|uniref:Uncharacterized protein n=1 Tax=Helicobacter valdiviensis TaxID=1458358 RepID=A0A2W6MVI7_9HELI|nr:hypothetical protein [Helicobacter valdiviensis]PZT47228.1 hypothetical protein B6S12_10175 [Helicobacter valdiviensis]
MLKFSKKNIIIILIVAFLISVMSNLYDYVNEALDYKNAKETKARENLNSLILWSKNEAKEELEYAKKLSKETYNQEKVTKEIIKNFEKIKTSIESMRILSSYGTTKEDMKLMRKAGKIILDVNNQIAGKLLHNENKITRRKTYFLFDKERFKAIEDFLFFLNTHLEEDFLQKDDKKIDSNALSYALSLTGSVSISLVYLNDIEKFPCKFNNPKTIAILQTLENLDKVAEKILNALEQLLILNDVSGKNRQNMIQMINIFQENSVEVQILQAKLKECEK